MAALGAGVFVNLPGLATIDYPADDGSLASTCKFNMFMLVMEKAYPASETEDAAIWVNTRDEQGNAKRAEKRSANGKLVAYKVRYEGDFFDHLGEIEDDIEKDDLSFVSLVNKSWDRLYTVSLEEGDSGGLYWFVKHYDAGSGLVKKQWSYDYPSRQFSAAYYHEYDYAGELLRYRRVNENDEFMSYYYPQEGNGATTYRITDADGNPLG